MSQEPVETDDFETIRIERPAEHLAEVVIDRPERMNEIDARTLEDLEAAADRLEADGETRTIMLSGAGGDAFSVGADVTTAGAMGHREGTEHSRQGQRTFGRFSRSDLSVVAAIDGHCLGGGLELAACADLRVASEGSEFDLPEHDLGLIPGWGGTQRLQRLVGESRARQIIFTSGPLPAERMAAFGFVNDVYPDEEFRESAIEFSADVAAGPPIAQRYTKRAMRAGRRDVEAGLEVEAQAFGHLMDTEDLAAGVGAFVGDGEPEFVGK